VHTEQTYHTTTQPSPSPSLLPPPWYSLVRRLVVALMPPPLILSTLPPPLGLSRPHRLLSADASPPVCLLYTSPPVCLLFASWLSCRPCCRAAADSASRLCLNLFVVATRNAPLVAPPPPLVLLPPLPRDAPPPPLDASPPHNWLCRCTSPMRRRRCR